MQPIQQVISSSSTSYVYSHCNSSQTLLSCGLLSHHPYIKGSCIKISPTHPDYCEAFNYHYGADVYAVAICTNDNLQCRHYEKHDNGTRSVRQCENDNEILVSCFPYSANGEVKGSYIGTPYEDNRIGTNTTCTAERETSYGDIVATAICCDDTDAIHSRYQLECHTKWSQQRVQCEDEYRIASCSGYVNKTNRYLASYYSDPDTNECIAETVGAEVYAIATCCKWHDSNTSSPTLPPTYTAAPIHSSTTGIPDKEGRVNEISTSNAYIIGTKSSLSNSNFVEMVVVPALGATIVMLLLCLLCCGMKLLHYKRHGVKTRTYEAEEPTTKKPETETEMKQVYTLVNQNDGVRMSPKSDNLVNELNAKLQKLHSASDEIASGDKSDNNDEDEIVVEGLAGDTHDLLQPDEFEVVGHDETDGAIST